jgi:DNA primase
LRRYTRNLILAFDADSAGQKAVLRAAEILLPLSVDLKVLRIPGGKDPDELFAHGGAAAIADALQHTVPWLEVLAGVLPERFDMASPVGRSQAAAFVCSFLKLVSNQVELEMYVQSAAAMLGVSEQAVLSELGTRQQNSRNSGVVQSVQPSLPPPPVVRRQDNGAQALLTLLELSLASADTGRLLAEKIDPELLSGATPLEKALDMAINAALNDEMEALPGMLQDLLLETPSPEVSKALVKPVVIKDKNLHDKALQEALADLIRIRKEQQRFALLEQIRNAAEPAVRLELLGKLQKLS